MRVRFHPEADAELHEAVSWYARQRLGLDAEFMRCVDATLAQIQRNPKRFPAVLRCARRALVKRFPYALFYEENDIEIMVLAVFHVKRDPDVWRLRVSGR